jgi:hypothetical protein
VKLNGCVCVCTCGVGVLSNSKISIAGPVFAFGALTNGAVCLTGSGSFLSPGLLNLLAIFSKGFFVSTTMSGFLSSFFYSVVDLSFLASLYLSNVDLL